MTNSACEIKQKIFHHYYSFLNEKQREAIFAPDGAVLVVAGAGSGKTTVLVNRISYLIRFGNAFNSFDCPGANEDEMMMLQHIADHGDLYPKEALLPILMRFSNSPCPPDRILAITFTNKAAGEIKARLEREIGPDSKNIWAGTFHSICVKLLRFFSDRTLYGNDFIIYDQNDCKTIVSSILKEKEIEDPELTPKYLINTISKAKNAMLSPKEFEAKNTGSEKRRICSQIYHLYQEKLRNANALDFDDLIVETVKLLQTDESARRWCQNKFRYVLVDEYQDTNHVQYELMKIICEGTGNVMVVGDDDQSIYKFRGAAVENILNFDKVFPNVRVVLLEQNYRSTKNIITAANAVIANNQSRRGKTLWSSNQVGRKVALRQLEDQEKEASFIAETISKLISIEKRRFSDFAVLYRTKAQSNILEQVFTKSALPHRLLSGLRFTDRAEVKDVVAYLRFIYNPNDFISMSRIINLPKRGIGKATVEKVIELAERDGKSVFDVLRECASYDEIKRSFAKISGFVSLIENLSSFAKDHMPSELLHKIIDESGYMETLLGDENEEKRENVNELISSALLFESRSDVPTLSSFLEEYALVSDVDNFDSNADAVTLMTVHAAKGLEFPIVFLAGMEENLFPSPQSSLTQSDLEEERRLAYVAMTRAKEELFITCCHHRTLFGRTNANPISRFVREIPEEYISIQLCQPNIRSEYDFYGKSPKDSMKIYSVSSFDKKTTVKTQPPKSHFSCYQSSKDAFETFSKGDRVVHGIFGAGIILETKKYASDTLYIIQFDHSGQKKLMATYAKLKKEQ